MCILLLATLKYSLKSLMSAALALLSTGAAVKRALKEPPLRGMIWFLEERGETVIVIITLIQPRAGHYIDYRTKLITVPNLLVTASTGK